MNFPQLITGYPKGSDITILDCSYRYPRKDEDSGLTKSDSVLIIFKDNKTGQKKYELIEKPEYAYYYKDINKYGDVGYNQFFESEDYLDLVICRYKDLNKSLAKTLGYSKEWFATNKADRSKMDMLIRDRRIFGSDIDINDFYRMRFAEQYTNEDISVNIGFFDIETDNAQIGGKFPEPGECPINAISYFDGTTKELYTLLLDTKNNPLIDEFICKYDEGAFNLEFREFLTHAFGGIQEVEKFKLSEIQTHVYMYTSEVDLIADFFNFVNMKRPDFMLAWNMAFDLPFIIERLKTLGINPEKIICDKEIPIKHCSYYIDDKHDEFAERGDAANITSFIVYLDQLIQFASRRKGTKFRNYKLDGIGEEIAGVRKLDYSDLTNNVWELPYLDYKRFVMYNMMDVLVQYCIEFKTDDIPYLYSKSLMNCTQFRKVHRQTIYLANRAIIRFYDYNRFVMGNNVNKFKPKPTDKYEGAFVADPILYSDKNKVKIDGAPIDMTCNTIDYDFKRLYPSLTQEYGMAPNTLIGKLEIPHRIYQKENGLHNPKYTRAGQFIEDFTSECPIQFCTRWLHLGTVSEVYQDIFEYFYKYEVPCIDIFNEFYSKDKIDIAGILDSNYKVNIAMVINDEQKRMMNTTIPNRLVREGEVHHD